MYVAKHFTWLLWISCAPLFAVEPANFYYVGSASCSSYGCHGNLNLKDTPTWKSSFTLWAKNDPHTNAYGALFSERSAHIVAVLSTFPEPDTPARQHSPAATVEDSEYWNVLKNRCVGCHATPLALKPTSHPPSENVEFQYSGLSCESCHGPANKWLAEHATSRWNGYSSKVKFDAWGFSNTRGLPNRAAICMDCHVGPLKDSAGKTYSVTHDLIAAGHPRLSFEFSAYHANLPPHWDEGKDVARVVGTLPKNDVRSFHFHAWRIGQWEMTRKLVSQLHDTSSLSGSEQGILWPEFSNFDCFACHHKLTSDLVLATGSSTKTLSARGNGKPESNDWPLFHVQAMMQTRDIPEVQSLAARLAVAREHFAFDFDEGSVNRQQVFKSFLNEFDESHSAIGMRSYSRREDLILLQRLLEEALSREKLRWDNLGQLQLAFAAFVADSPDSVGTRELKQETQRLLDYLNRQYDDAKPTIYDSPTNFRRNDPFLQLRLQAIAEALKRIQPENSSENERAP